MMSKRKPSKLTGIRIEFQERERELIEQDILLRNSTKLIGSLFHSLAMMPPQNMYAWLTLLEALGIVDTPIPTLGDMDEVLNAIKTWADERQRKKEETYEQQQQQRDQYQEMNPDFIPTGNVPNYVPPGSNTEKTDYTDPMNRYPVE